MKFRIVYHVFLSPKEWDQVDFMAHNATVQCATTFQYLCYYNFHVIIAGDPIAITDTIPDSEKRPAALWTKRESNPKSLTRQSQLRLLNQRGICFT